jgi:hypothetical protein
MKYKPTLMIVFLLYALITSSVVSAHDVCDYQAALEKARATLADVETKTQLWSTSDILLEKAAEAAAAGDVKLAVELANEARLHGELALATAMRVKDVWEKSVPK